MSAPAASPDPASAYQGKRVLVTGGLGFIGSTVARRLADLGAEVRVVDALVPEHGGNWANLAAYEKRIEVRLADLRDPAVARAAVPGVDYVFNLAGQVSHLDSMRDPVTDLTVNALVQPILLDACRALAPEAPVVYASTRQIYGKPDYLPVDEAHPIRPVDVNGINKMAGEAYHTLYHQVYGQRCVSLRLTNTYGPCMRIKDARQTFLGVWLRHVVEDTCLEVWGGQQRRDLVYVDDVAEAFLLAAANPSAWGRVFNVGGGPPVTLEALATLLVETAGSGRFQKREFPPERKRIDIGDYFADDRPFRAVTGWRPTVGLGEGLARSLAYYRANLPAYL
jgi:nucleoside-diphosphate-sugar epimerase